MVNAHTKHGNTRETKIYKNNVPCRRVVPSTPGLDPLSNLMNDGDKINGDQFPSSNSNNQVPHRKRTKTTIFNKVATLDCSFGAQARTVATTSIFLRCCFIWSKTAIHTHVTMFCPSSRWQKHDKSCL